MVARDPHRDPPTPTPTRCFGFGWFFKVSFFGIEIELLRFRAKPKKIKVGDKNRVTKPKMQQTPPKNREINRRREFGPENFVT